MRTSFDGSGTKRREKRLLTDVTASGDGVEEGSVDGLHGGLEVLLDDTVELPGLSSRHLHGTITVLISDLGHLKPLGSGSDTSGESDSNLEKDEKRCKGSTSIRQEAVNEEATTNHERVGRLKSGSSSLVSDVSVV